MLTESDKNSADAIYDATVLAGDHWMHEIKEGQTFRIEDLEGNQAADTLFYDTHDVINRYSACDTIRVQRSLYLIAGWRALDRNVSVKNLIARQKQLNRLGCIDPLDHRPEALLDIWPVDFFGCDFLPLAVFPAN